MQLAADGESDGGCHDSKMVKMAAIIDLDTRIFYDYQTPFQQQR